MYSILSHCSGNVLHRLFEVCELLGTSFQSTVCYDGSTGSFSLQSMQETGDVEVTLMTVYCLI
jgi:hypothetical protein